MKSITQAIREKILKFLRLDRLAANPNSERYRYVNDPEELPIERAKEGRVWYIGDSNELLNFYTEKDAGGFAGNPVYNRNRANYFWAISAQEEAIKRVHSGLPRAMVDALTAIVGLPAMTAVDKETGEEVDLRKLLKKSGFRSAVMQKQLPLTLAEGWGAFKVCVDPDKMVTEYPTVRYYEAQDVEFAVKGGIVVGIVYKDYYSYGGKDYVLLETRRVNESGNSEIDYELMRLSRNDEVKPVPLSEIPELGGLKNVEIPGYREILGVPCRIMHDPDNPNYGRSIFAGKIDVFDDLDQSLSQASQTCRVSTPVEYYPTSLLQRGRDGHPLMPKVYNRQYVENPSVPDGDGKVNQGIVTTQPQLNFAQYSDYELSLARNAMNGILSPSSLGMDVSLKDNADAQREKEKVTIMTRDTVIAEEGDVLESLVECLLACKEYMDTGSISVGRYEVSARFSEFANPSFESLSQTLLPLWQAGAISDEMYVEKLYGHSMSEADKARELEALRKNREADRESALGGLEAYEDKPERGQGGEGLADGLPAEAQGLPAR